MKEKQWREELAIPSLWFLFHKARAPPSSPLTGLRGRYYYPLVQMKGQGPEMEPSAQGYTVRGERRQS